MRLENTTPAPAANITGDIPGVWFGKDISVDLFKKCLVYLFLFGLIVRAGFLVEHAHSPSFGVVTLDQKYYDMVAKMLLTGEDLHQLHGLRPLLYPMFLAFLYKLGGAHGIDLAVIVQHLLGVGTGIVVALLGARLFRHRLCGIVGGALFLLAPVPLYFEGELLIEPSYTFLICLALWLHLRAAEINGTKSVLVWMVHGGWIAPDMVTITFPSVLVWMVCGGLIALAAQERANILVFLAVYPLLAAWRCWHARGFGTKEVLPLAGLVGALLMAMPWGVFNMRQTDHFHLIPNAGGVNLYLGNKRTSDGMVPAQERRVTYGERYEDSVEIWAREEYGAAMRAAGGAPDPDPMAVSKYWTARAIAEIKADPAAWLRLVAKKCWLTLWNREVPNNKSFAFLQQEFLLLRLLPVRWVVLLMLAPAGIWAAVKYGNRDALFILLVYAALYLAANVAFFICDRYRYPVWPVMAAIAGGGLLAAIQALLRHRLRAAMGMAAGMAVMAALSLPNWFGAQLPNFARDYLFRSIAWYEKGHFPEALDDINHSVQLDPLDATALQQRGNILLALNRLDEAKTDYEKNLKFTPDDGSVWNNYGNALEGLGQTNEALQAFTHATQCQPPSQNAYLSLIFLQLRANHLDEADTLLAKVEKESPGSEDAVHLAIHSVLSRKRGDAVQAEALERKARSIDADLTQWAIERATTGGRSVKSN